jgi:hypothetical protein
MSADLSTTDPANNLPLIRASELTQYSFCHRAWWLSTVKQVSSNHQAALIRGTRVHRDHTYQVRVAHRWRQASFFLLGGGGLLLSVALFWYLFQ